MLLQHRLRKCEMVLLHHLDVSILYIYNRDYTIQVLFIIASYLEVNLSDSRGKIHPHCILAKVHTI